MQVEVGPLQGVSESKTSYRLASQKCSIIEWNRTGQKYILVGKCSCSVAVSYLARDGQFNVM